MDEVSWLEGKFVSRSKAMFIITATMVLMFLTICGIMIVDVPHVQPVDKTDYLWFMKEGDRIYSIANELKKLEPTDEKYLVGKDCLAAIIYNYNCEALEQTNRSDWRLEGYPFQFSLQEVLWR